MGYPGWYIGFAIAFVLIWIVVICVANILNLARRIGVQSREISLALNATGDNTDAMHRVATINRGTASVNDGLGRVRGHLYGGEYR